MHLKQPLSEALKASFLAVSLFLSSSALYAIDPDESAEEQAIEADSDRIMMFEANTWKVNSKGKIKICPGEFINKKCIDGYTDIELEGIPASSQNLKKYLREAFPDNDFRIDSKTILPNGELYVFITFKG